MRGKGSATCQHSLRTSYLIHKQIFFFSFAYSRRYSVLEHCRNLMDSTIVRGSSEIPQPDPLWEEARDIFFQDLGQAKRVKFDDTTRLEDTITSLSLAQTKVSKEYGTHILRVGKKDLDVKVSRIMRRLELMLQVGDAAMRFGPESVSLVWSAFRLIFTVCLSSCRAHYSLAD